MTTTAAITSSDGNTHPAAQPARRRASPRLHINIVDPSHEPTMRSEDGTPGVWYRPELAEEDIPLNLGAEISWDGTKGISVAQGRQRSNTVAGASLTSLGASPPLTNGLGFCVAEAEEPQPPNAPGDSSAYGYGVPLSADFDDELTRRLLREKRQLIEEGRWIDDGDIGSIESRRTVPDDQNTASNLLCNTCFHNLGDVCFTRCKHIFCSSDLDEHTRRSLHPETLELACPACGTLCTYGRDIISVATGRPLAPALALGPVATRRDPLAERPQTQRHESLPSKTIKQRSIDQTKRGKTSQLPSPPITPAPTLPISLYEQRAFSAEKARRAADQEIRNGLIAAIQKAVGEQFSRFFSILAFALVLWVLVK